MNEKKIKKLKEELKKYKTKLKQMQVDWSETKAGSRYGDEYLEMQIKVYNQMIVNVDEEIKKERSKK
jgi:hypothetical protein